MDDSISIDAAAATPRRIRARHACVLAITAFQKSIAIILFLLAWEFLPRLGYINRTFLPPFSEVVVFGCKFAASGQLWEHTQATRAFAAAAQARGVELREGAEVVAVREEGGVASVILASGEHVRAGRAVILAANTHVDGLLTESFGLRLPVWTFNPQVATIKVSRALKLDHLVNHNSRSLSIKRADADHVTVTGGGVGTWDDATEIGTSNLNTLSASLAALTATFPITAADAHVVDVEASRADSSSVDQIPIIDRVPGHPAVWFATGWSGHGFAIGPAVAEAVAQGLLEQRIPAVLQPFGLHRFQP